MNTIDVLSKISGQSKETVKSIWEEVKENHKKLDACPGPHKFTIPFRSSGELIRDWSCELCGGHISSSDKSWYEKGLNHGSSTLQKE